MKTTSYTLIAAVVGLFGLFACNVMAGPYEDSIIATNPTAFYQLTETSSFAPVSNSINPGTYDLEFFTGYNITVQQPSPSFPGATNPSVQTDGHEPCRIVGTVSALANTSFSVEFLIQDLSASASLPYNFLFSKGDDSLTSLNIGVDHGGGGVGPAGNLFIGNNNQYFDTGVAMGNGWNQLALTYDSTTGLQSLYLNGSMVYSTTQMVSASGYMSFGQRMDGAGPTLGNFADLSLYNTVLDASTIHSQFEALTVPEPSTVASLSLALGFTLWGMRRKLRRIS